MSGLTSRDRYHAYDWQSGAPYPGELEYLGWRGIGMRHGPARTGFDKLVRMPPALYLGNSVKSDTVYKPWSM